MGDFAHPTFLLTFALFAVLLIAFPGRRSFSGDEIRSILMARGGVFSPLRAAVNEGQPPLFFLILGAVRAIAGEGSLAMRLPSAGFALGAFAFLFAVARRLFGRSVWIPAWLLATSSFVVFAARLVRPYSLLLLLTAAATWLLLTLLERPSRRLWIAYGLVIALSVYTSYLAIVVILAHAVVMVLAWRDEPRRFIPPLTVFVIVGVLFLPWAGTMGAQLGRNAQRQAGIGFGECAKAAVLHAVYAPYAFVAGDSISPFALPFSALVAFFYGILTVIGLNRVRRGRTARRHLLPAIVGLGLLAAAVSYLLGWGPSPTTFTAGRLLFVAPFFVLILACGFISIGDRRVRAAAFATALAIQAVSLFNYYSGREWSNWAYVLPSSEIAAYVSENAQADDLVILDTYNLSRGPAYYWRGKARLWQFIEPGGQLPVELKSAERVWVVRSVRDNSPGRKLESLVDYLKLNFVLDLQASRRYVREPPAVYAKKRRWVRRLFGRDVHPYKVETLLFERVKAG